MHIQSCFCSSTGANLFCGIKWFHVILPKSPNSWNTLKVLLAIKLLVRNTSESEQLHSYLGLPCQITCTRSCQIRICTADSFLPLAVPWRWGGGGRGHVCALVCMYMWWWHSGCVSDVRGEIKMFSCSLLWVPGGIPSWNSAKDLMWSWNLTDFAHKKM